MVPVLHYLLGHPWDQAVALSLFVIMTQSPLGLWRHRVRAAVDLRMGLVLAAGGLVGVYVGILLAPRLGVPFLKAVFALLMVFAAYRMVARVPVRPDGQRVGAPVLALLGFGAGVVSRLLGIGGGILTVPVLALLGVPAHLAVGTSLLPVFTNAAWATAWNLATGLAWLPAVPLAAGALVGAPLGVRAAHALPERGLRRVIAAGLVVVAATIAWEAL